VRRRRLLGLALVLLAGACTEDDLSSVTTITAEPPVTTTTSTTAPPSTLTTAPPDTSASAPLSADDAAELVSAIEGPEGHWVPDISTYDPEAELSVIVASVPLATVSSPQQVFFFHDGIYAPTEALEARSGIGVAGAIGNTVTISYAHYQPEDPNCCPSLPDYTVRFRWDGTAVQLLDPLPPADQGTAG
jgi:LppP/LprE lipoprotein